jgi:hypothetical protein
MQVIITAAGPDNRGLAAPTVHRVTSAGANIAEIQMYDHDAEKLFAMPLRMDRPAERQPVADLRDDGHYRPYRAGGGAALPPGGPCRGPRPRALTAGLGTTSNGLPFRALDRCMGAP